MRGGGFGANRVTDGADFFYVRQNLPLGLGHAVLRSMDLVGQEPFAVVLSDDVIDAKVPVLKQMIDEYEKYSAGAVLAIPFSSGFILRLAGQERGRSGEIEEVVFGIRGCGRLEQSRLLAVSVAAAAIVAHFARSDLVPGLRHVP